MTESHNTEQQEKSAKEALYCHPLAIKPDDNSPHKHTHIQILSPTRTSESPTKPDSSVTSTPSKAPPAVTQPPISPTSHSNSTNHLEPSLHPNSAPLDYNASSSQKGRSMHGNGSSIQGDGSLDVATGHGRLKASLAFVVCVL